MQTDRWHWGDATEEMMYSTSSGTKNWYGDDADFVHNTATWMYRGGHAEDGTKAGIFAYNRHGGGATNYSSFRTVITAP